MPCTWHQLLCSTWQKNALGSARRIRSSLQILHKAVHILSLTRYMALLSDIIDSCSLLEPRVGMHAAILWLTRKKCIWVILREYNSSEGTNILLMLTALRMTFILYHNRGMAEKYSSIFSTVSHPSSRRVTSEMERVFSHAVTSLYNHFWCASKNAICDPSLMSDRPRWNLLVVSRGVPLRCFPAHLWQAPHHHAKSPQASGSPSVLFKGIQEEFSL